MNTKSQQRRINVQLGRDIDDGIAEIERAQKFETILNDFNKAIALENKKYPFSDRELVFTSVIRELLVQLINMEISI